MKIATITALMFLLVIASISFAAASQEASVRVKVNYFANWGEGADTSDFIFVGDDAEAIGQADVIIPLTENGQVIIDDPMGDDDVPGLHVIRGFDETGPYIDLVNYAFNHPDESRESIKFRTIFRNSEIDHVDIERNGHGTYEKPFEQGCGIPEEDGDASNDRAGNDEVEVLDENRIKFCSVASGKLDGVRVYYTFDDLIPPVITDITTDPQSPVYNNGEEQDIIIDFESSEYPIEVLFKLRDSNEDVINRQGPYIVNSEDDLPLTYTVPNDLADGTYELFMKVTDAAGNVVEVFVGTIIVDSMAPSITDISTDPELPIEVEEGESKDIAVNFDSDEFPIDVLFELEDDSNSIVHTQGPTRVNSENDLPVIYTVPNNLAPGTYELYMVVSDLAGNDVRVFVGSIEITEDKCCSGGKDKKKKNRDHDDDDVVIVESVKPLEQTKKSSGGSILLSEGAIRLGETSNEEGFNQWLLVWLLLLLIILTIILIILTIIMRA